jgi:hypothetical protein
MAAARFSAGAASIALGRCGILRDERTAFEFRLGLVSQWGGGKHLQGPAMPLLALVERDGLAAVA